MNTTKVVTKQGKVIEGTLWQINKSSKYITVVDDDDEDQIIMFKDIKSAVTTTRRADYKHLNGVRDLIATGDIPT